MTNAIRVANKGEVAEFFEVSLTTVDGWIRRGCPFIQRGSLASPWTFDLLAVAEWRFKGSATKDAQNNPDRMSPTDLRAWYDAQAKKLELMAKARALVPAAELAQVIPTAYSTIAQSLRAIPDNLERRLSLPPEAIELAAEAIDHALDDLADRLERLTPIENR